MVQYVRVIFLQAELFRVEDHFLLPQYPRGGERFHNEK